MKPQSHSAHPLGIVLVLAVFFFASLHTSAQNDVIYHGKSINIWFNELASTNAEVHEAAQVAFEHLGSNALPFLMNQAAELGGFQESDEPAFQRSTNARLANLSLNSAFRALGPAAKPAEPELVNAFETGRYPFIAAWILLRLDGTNAAMMLTHGLTNRLFRVRLASASRIALATNATDTERIVPGLLACLNDEVSDTNSVYLRGNAADALGILGFSPETVVPALLQRLTREATLSDESRYPVRASVVRALGRYGGKARSAIPQLQGLTNEAVTKSVTLRRAAAGAIKAIEAQK